MEVDLLSDKAIATDTRPHSDISFKREKDIAGE